MAKRGQGGGSAFMLIEMDLGFKCFHSSEQVDRACLP